MSQPAKELYENSPVQMAEVIAGLLAGRTISDVSETTGVPKGRITRWYRESEQFQAMLTETTDDIVKMVRAEVVSETSERLTELLPGAIDALEAAMTHGKMSERVTAAAHVMRFAGLGGRKEAPRATPAVEGLLKGSRGPTTGD